MEEITTLGAILAAIPGVSALIAGYLVCGPGEPGKCAATVQNMLANGGVLVDTVRWGGQTAGFLMLMGGKLTLVGTQWAAAHPRETALAIMQMPFQLYDFGVNLVLARIVLAGFLGL